MPRNGAILIKHGVYVEVGSRLLRPQHYKDCGTRPAVHGCGYPPFSEERRTWSSITHVSGTADMLRCLTIFWRKTECVLRQDEECRRSGFIPIAMQRSS